MPSRRRTCPNTNSQDSTDAIKVCGLRWGGWMNNLWQGNMWVSGRAFLAHKFCSMIKLQCHLKSIKMVINLWKCMSFRCQLMQSNLNSHVTEILPLGDNSGCNRILVLSHKTSHKNRLWPESACWSQMCEKSDCNNWGLNLVVKSSEVMLTFGCTSWWLNVDHDTCSSCYIWSPSLESRLH